MGIGADQIPMTQSRPAGSAGHRRRMNNDQAVFAGHIRRRELSIIIKQRLKFGKITSRWLQVVIFFDSRKQSFSGGDHRLVVRINE